MVGAEVLGRLERLLLLLRRPSRLSRRTTEFLLRSGRRSDRISGQQVRLQRRASRLAGRTAEFFSRAGGRSGWILRSGWLSRLSSRRAAEFLPRSGRRSGRRSLRGRWLRRRSGRRLLLLLNLRLTAGRTRSLAAFELRPAAWRARLGRRSWRWPRRVRLLLHLRRWCRRMRRGSRRRSWRRWRMRCCGGRRSRRMRRLRRRRSRRAGAGGRRLLRWRCRLRLARRGWRGRRWRRLRDLETFGVVRRSRLTRSVWKIRNAEPASRRVAHGSPGQARIHFRIGPWVFRAKQ